MPKRKVLKQKTLLDFVEKSSPTRPSRAKSPSPPGSPVRPTRFATKAKGKAREKRRALYIASEDEEENGSEGGGSTSSDVGAIGFEPKAAAVSSASDNESITHSPRKPASTPRRIRKRRAGSIPGSPISIDSDSPEPVGVPVFRKGGATVAKRKHAALQDSSEEEGEAQPRRRKLVKGIRPPTPEENCADLLEEVDSNKIIEGRFRTRGKKSTYEKNLEKLRKRKLKQNVESSMSESEGSEEDDNEPFDGARPHMDGDSDVSGNEDEGLSGFIEEDSVNAVAPELPAEFSMNTYQDLMHHFKIICQLFVHLAVHDPEERQSFMEQSLKDNYFSVPLQIARRKLAGMKDSSVTSSVWKTPFKKALEMYPNFETLLMDFANPGCDACNLGGRLSTIVGRVSGDPYDRMTFEPLDLGNSDEDTDEDEDDEPKLKKEFNLGRFCARRTRVFHRFTHWEYALFSSLSEEVNDLKSRSTKRRVFVPVAYAGGLNPPDDISDADAIMNWLDERGVIGAEWHKIKEMMDNATNLEVASKRGDDID